MMNEKLLQYLWNFKIFTNTDFRDTDGKQIEVLDFGTWNHNSGADFLYGKIKHHGLVLAGNIELHVKSSDWIFHRHSDNPDFENIILHAVYEHDLDIAAFAEKNIPTIELKNYISDETLLKYGLLLNEVSFIPCEEIFSPDKIPFYFNEQTLLSRLYEKSILIEKELKKYKNDFEAVLFHQIAYAFGLKVNAEIFKQLAESVDFSTIRKISRNQDQLEALFFGLANWLNKPQDSQMKKWKTEFDYLKKKHQIQNEGVRPKYLRLRPPNFPTIRLSQLAHLYHVRQNLFSQVLMAKTAAELFNIFEHISASAYWNNRFNFGKVSTIENEKILSQNFIEVIILNAILPMKYTCHKHFNENIPEEITNIYRSIKAEENSIVNNWKRLGCEVDSALESQALIHHYHHFCEVKNCLNCSIGLQLLK